MESNPPMLHLQLCCRFLSDLHGIHKLLTMRIVLPKCPWPVILCVKFAMRWKYMEKIGKMMINCWNLGDSPNILEYFRQPRSGKFHTCALFLALGEADQG